MNHTENILMRQVFLKKPDKHKRELMTALAKNLAILMQHYGLTETGLARKTHVGQPVVHRLASGETDNPKINTLSPIAKLFGLNINQLIGEAPLPEQLPTSIPETAPAIWRTIPRVDLQHTPNGQTHTDLHLSEDAFAVQLIDDMMAPTYPMGSEIIIEPALSPQDEDYVLARLPGEKSAIFRQYLNRGEDIYLKPLHPEHTPQKLDEAFTLLGVMVQGRVNL